MINLQVIGFMFNKTQIYRDYTTQF